MLLRANLLISNWSS